MFSYIEITSFLKHKVENKKIPIFHKISVKKAKWGSEKDVYENETHEHQYSRGQKREFCGITVQLSQRKWTQLRLGGKKKVWYTSLEKKWPHIALGWNWKVCTGNRKDVALLRRTPLWNSHLRFSLHLCNWFINFSSGEKAKSAKTISIHGTILKY